MDTALRVLLAIVVPYVIGSITWAFIIVRLFWKQDIRTLGSGNTGATNVLRVFGTVPGVAVLLLDALKGALGVWIATALAPEAAGVIALDWFKVIGALAAIAGHSFSFLIGFSGGKAWLLPQGRSSSWRRRPSRAPAHLLPHCRVSRIVSVGSLSIGVCFPVVSWFRVSGEARAFRVLPGHGRLLDLAPP
jgi:glycerol-3-phosphate acyltransferase PlsY